MQVCMQRLEAAEACKQEGNRLYVASDLEEAVVRRLPLVPNIILPLTRLNIVQQAAHT